MTATAPLTLADLWDAPAAPTITHAPAQRRSRTSRAAADAVAGAPVASQAERVRLAVLASMANAAQGHGYGLTREQIAEQTAIRLTSVCGRVSELLKAGVLVEPGIWREGSCGVRQSVLWVAKERGEPTTYRCGGCGRGAVSRLYLVAGSEYRIVRSCAVCWWSEVR